MATVTEDHVWHAARSLMRGRTHRDFVSAFGKTPDVIATMWNMLICNEHDHKAGLRLKHLLWTCLFVKHYGSESNVVNQCRTSPNAFRKYRNLVLLRSCGIRGKVVSIDCALSPLFVTTCCLTLVVVCSD